MSNPTAAQFKEAYPEFTSAPDAIVDQKIQLSVLRTDATVWGDLWGQGVFLRTADALARSPEGRKMRLVSDKGESIYHKDLRTLVTRVACGVGRTT